MTNVQQEMVEYNVQDVIRFIVEDNHIPVEQAMEKFFMSETFEKLNDAETGLYLEGPAYIYQMLQKEGNIDIT